MPLLRRSATKMEVIVPHDRRKIADISAGSADPPAKKRNQADVRINPAFQRLLNTPALNRPPLAIEDAKTQPERGRRTRQRQGPYPVPQRLLDRLSINPAFQRFLNQPTIRQSVPIADAERTLRRAFDQPPRATRGRRALAPAPSAAPLDVQLEIQPVAKKRGRPTSSRDTTLAIPKRRARKPPTSAVVVD